MTSNLNPYISFDGNAREAMEFYRDALGGDLTVSTFGDMGDTGPAADKVMHSRLETPAGFQLMAADTPPGMEYRPGQNISISITGPAADAANLHRYWEALSAGGTISVPLEKQPWGDEMGACVDRFGIAWLVDIGTEDSAQ